MNQAWKQRLKLAALPIGAALLTLGTVLSLRHGSAAVAASSGAMILAGLVSMHLSGKFVVRHGKRRDKAMALTDKLEILSYIATAALLLVVLLAAALRYFDNMLTFAFVAAFSISVIFLFRRIL